jgi:SAM-dependent methyltransferase
VISLSSWKQKKRQQKVFDEITNGVLHDDSKLIGQLLRHDGELIIEKAKTYVERVRADGVIIDAGCGTGNFINEITNGQTNSLQIIGIDISLESIKMAKQENTTADFIVCDIEVLPLREEIADLIVMRNVMHHLPSLEPMGALFRLLNSGGFMLIDDKIRGNPFQEILTLGFPLIPKRFKLILREKDNHIDKEGNLPPIKMYSPRYYLKFINQYSDKLIPVDVKYHGFFLFLSGLQYLSYIFPIILKIQLPISRLYALENRRILRWSAVSMTIVVENR